VSDIRPLPSEEYDLLDLLERLESLIEDMDDLDVTTRAEAAYLIEAIQARLDAMDAAAGLE
jgi:hypothetical protein